MVQLIAHRGWWWPRNGLQNHPSSVTAAWDAGYGVEIDVQDTHDFDLWLGHDRKQYSFELPSMEDTEQISLILHLKSPSIGKRVCEILHQKGWLDRAAIFFSPSNDAAINCLRHESPAPQQGPKRFLTVDNAQSLQVLFDLPEVFHGADGVWLEQPDKNWVSQEIIYAVHSINKTCYVVSPELHGRMVDLAFLQECNHADGICTDFPHLFSRIFDQVDTVVHPHQLWWSIGV